MDKEEMIRYSYYDEDQKYCVVLDSDKLKVLFGAQKIFIDTEE